MQPRRSLFRATCLLALAWSALASCTSSPGSHAPDATPSDTGADTATGDSASPLDVAPESSLTDSGPAFDAPDLGGRRPNFIFVLAEANGWTSTSVTEDERVPSSRSATAQTPSLDRLASQGMRFSNFYAPSPRCMPTRASLLSGRSPAALQMTFIPESRTDGASTGAVIPPSPLTTLPPTTPTVASILRAAGYATAHFGKWHAGSLDPAMYGFDASDGPTANRGPDNVDHPNPVQAYRITDRALEFINAQAALGRPFYLQVSSYGGKDEIDARPETFAATTARLPGANPRDIAVAAVQSDLDLNLVRILTRLDELGLSGITYVVFSSDHGAQGPSSNLPLHEGKGTVWEGGIRVPLFVRGPGITPGSLSRVRVSGVDLLPTLAALAGVSTLPPDLEGASLLPLFSGASALSRARDEFVVHFPHYDHDPLGPASTILLGDYKLIRFYETGSLRLFNLATDLGETTDLAAREPARVADLDRRLTEYLTSVRAQLPTRR